MKIDARKTHPTAVLCILVFFVILGAHVSGQAEPFESRELLFLIFVFLLALGHAAESRETIIVEPMALTLKRRGSEIIIQRSDISRVQRKGGGLRIETTGGKVIWSSDLLSERQVERILKEFDYSAVSTISSETR